MNDWLVQAPYGVRFDWGLAGAERLAPASACLVIVDVLSFSTAVTVAVQAGIRVFPYPRHDGAAATSARQQHAVLAASRRAGSPGTPWSLSPAAGERWPDGSLRPALEDLLGAGAVLAAWPARSRWDPRGQGARRQQVGRRGGAGVPPAQPGAAPR